MVNYTQAREKLHSGKGQKILHLRRRNRETLLGAIASISELRRSLGLATHGAAVRFHICSLTRTPLIANDGKAQSLQSSYRLYYSEGAGPLDLLET